MSEFQVNNSGNKERLGEMKHGVRREQLDAKFRSLFDQLDTNKNGTLELGELEVNNADMVEFTQAVSRAAEEITDTQEKEFEDGSKELVTYYKDGTIETIGYYPDGGYKYKKTEIPHSVTKYWINAKEVSKEEYEKALKNPPLPPQRTDSISFSAVNISSQTYRVPEIKEEYSIRYQADKVLDRLCKGLDGSELSRIKERFASLIEQYPEQDWLKNLDLVKEVLGKNKLTANFDNVADALESLNVGMTIRNEEEWEASSQRREERELREFAKDLLAYIFEIAGAMQQDYHDNQGLADFGFYSERLNDLICKLGGESDFTRSYAQAAKNCVSLAEQSNNIPTLNDEVFNAEFEKLNGGKLNLEGLKKLKALVTKEGFDFQKDIYGKEFNAALQEMLGSSLIEDVQDSMDINSILSGVGDIAVMLMTLGAAAETKAVQMFGKAAMQTFGKAGAKLSARAMALSNPVARGTMKFAGKVVSLGGGAVVGGTHLAGYTGAKETINNLTNPTRDALSIETWNSTADGMIQSFGFGAFGGIWGQTVTSRVMSAVNRTSSKTMSALAPKFAEGSVKGSDVLKVFLEKSAPGNIAKAMGFASEVIGFTAYESALNIFLHIEGEVTFEKAVEVLWEEFKTQGYTLGQIKLVAMLLMGSKAARAAESQAFEEGGLKDVEVIPHPEKNEFLIKTPEGKMYVCKNENEMFSACMLLARSGNARIDHSIKNKNTLNSISERYSTPNIKSLAEEIQACMEGIKDKTITEAISKTFENINSGKLSEKEIADTLADTLRLINAYHCAVGDYITIKDTDLSPTDNTRFIKFIQKTNPNMAIELSKNPGLFNRSEYKELIKDFKMQNQYGELIEYLKEHDANDPIAKHLYKEYYLKNIDFPGSVKENCLALQEKYGIRIILSSQIANRKIAENLFNAIDQELAEWTRASGGSAKIPPVLDFLGTKVAYINEKSAYGEGASAGYTESYKSKAVSIRFRNDIEDVINILRHEMTHSNDTKLLDNFPDGIIVNAQKPNILNPFTNEYVIGDIYTDIRTSKFANELYKAGVIGIGYAYKNPKEFIARAAEGDMSKYSPELKAFLVEMGMPEWMLDMKPATHIVEENIMYAADRNFNNYATAPDEINLGSEVGTNMTLLLNGKYTLDLSSPELVNRIQSLNEGEIINIGKSYGKDNIDLGNSGITLSRENNKLMIRGGRFLEKIELVEKPVEKIEFIEEIPIEDIELIELQEPIPENEVEVISVIEALPSVMPNKPKLKTEISEAQGSGIISISTEAGENVGNVNFNVITYPNGKKVLHFEGLVSQIDGAGVGSKLISELIKKSYELGAEGRIEATASPMKSVSGKLTNLGFYYKMGFRAVDPKVDAQIRECIDSGKEIPIALNYNVKLEYKITKPEINKAVADIQGEFDEAACDEIVEELETLGFGDAMNMTHRAKSSQSLFDKIKNYMIEHPGATIEAAVKDVRDGFGARRIVKSANYARKTSGTMEERINQAIEMQSKPLYDAIIRNINELANREDGLAMIRMSNYATADGQFAYLTKTQYEKIRDYAAERGIDFKGNELVDPTDPKAGEATPFKDYEGGITKTQPSGYPAFQMNFMTKSGKVIEYQFRGDRIDIFAEGEHIPYDLRTGKDIIGQHPELEPLYGPIKNLLEGGGMPKESVKEYNRYWQDYYIHLRKLELGFESTEPKLEDYGNGFKFDKRLEAKNLVFLHELGEKVKKGEIKPEEAVKRFNANIDNNSIYWECRNQIDANLNGTFQEVPPEVTADALKAMNCPQEIIDAMKEGGLQDYDMQALINSVEVFNRYFPNSKYAEKFVEALKDTFYKNDESSLADFDLYSVKKLTDNTMNTLLKIIDTKNYPEESILNLFQGDIKSIINKLTRAKLKFNRCFNHEAVELILKLGAGIEVITLPQFDMLIRLGVNNIALGKDNLELISKFEKNKNLQENEYTQQMLKISLSRIHDYIPEAQVYIREDFINKCLSKFDNIHKLGYDDFTTFTLSSIKNLEPQKIKDTAQCIESLRNITGDSFNTSVVISKFINRHPNIDLVDLNNYIQTIDFNKIKSLVPNFKEFSSDEILDFIEYHYRENTTDFSEKSLSLDKDFTEFLAQNYADYETLRTLFATKPLTPKEIGSLPEGWTYQTESPAATEGKIRNAIEEFRKEVDMDINGTNVNKSMDKLAKSLESILGKPVEIERLGAGVYGTGYKISVENANPVVLKIFFKQSCHSEEHGQWAEPQRGPFLNEHSNEFAHFYFGKVASRFDNDGFMVTEFLDNNTESIQKTKANDPKYTIMSEDAHSGNIIHGTIIDYGGVRVIENSSKKPFGI